MKSFTRYSMALVTFCVLVGQISAGDFKSDFLNTFNGVFTNKEQLTHVAPNSTTAINVKVTFVPVKVSKLRGSVIYVELLVNEQVIDRDLWSVSFNRDQVVSIRIYKITSTAKSGDFDRDAVLGALKSKDLHSNKDCVGTFVLLPNGWFLGGLPKCSDDAIGKYPMYLGIATCSGILFNYPPITTESTPTIPVAVTREGERYPVPGIPASYSNPCDSKNQ